MLRIIASVHICMRLAVLALAILSNSFAVRANAVAENTDEWRQARADSAHSSYLPTTIHPPLTVAWRIPIHGDGGVEGSGNTIYLTDSGYASGLDMAHIPTWPIVEALSARDGTVMWGVRSESQPPESAFDSIATPVGVIQLDSNYHHPVLRCLAENDGRELWRYSFDSNSGADLSCQLTNGNVLLSEERNPSGLAYLDEIDSSTGRLVNRRLLDLGNWDSERRYLYGNGGQIPGPGDWLYISNGLTTITLMGGVLGTIHGLLWTDVSNIWTAPVAGTNFLYLGLVSDQSMLALDKRAERVWETRLPPNDIAHHSPGPSNVAVTPKFLVYVFGSRLFALDRYSGRIAWKSSRGMDVQYGPIVTGGIVYVSTINKPGQYEPNAITAFSLKTGRALWTKIIGYSITHIVAHRGALYVVDRSEDNRYSLMRLNQAGA